MKIFSIFRSPSIRMSGKNIIFHNKKVKFSDLYKNKKVIKIDITDIDKIWFQKNNHIVKISRLK